MFWLYLSEVWNVVETLLGRVWDGFGTVIIRSKPVPNPSESRCKLQQDLSNT